MSRSAASARDAGFELIGRINRWVIAGAVVLSGAISVAAAKSFHGKSHSTTTTPATASPAPSSGSNSTGSSSDDAPQQPASAPSPAPAGSSAAPAVSGGS